MSAAPKVEASDRTPIDPEKIPAEMRALDQWVVWRYQWRKSKGVRKRTKVPYQARRPDSPADSTDRLTWAPFAVALRAYLDPTSDVHGLGFVFDEDCPFAGVDFDNCLDESGIILEWARPFLERLVGYAEVSPSGRGVKAFVMAEIPGGKGRKLLKLGPDKTGVIEVYDRGRYFTVTSRPLESHGRMRTDDGEFLALFDEWFPPKSRARARAPENARPLKGDAEVIAKIERSRQAAKFSALWGGSIEGHPSKSEADLALCSILAWWVGGDIDAIDRLFRQSRLCDEKWDRITYREPTIDRACDQPSFYDPNYRSGGAKVYPRAYQPDSPVPETRNDDPEIPKVDKPERPVIEVNTQRHEVVDYSVTALRSDPSLYARAGMLVDVVQEAEDLVQISAKTAFEKMAGSPKVVGISDAIVGCRLTRYAEFYQWKTTKSGEFISVPAHPPDWLIKSVATLKSWPGIRRLDAVAECPFPRPDGSIVETPGYDAETATVLMPSIEFPPIPAAPTRGDAESSWLRISEYIKEFPFASDDDRVVYLAGVLTIVGRPAVPGPVPGIAVIGNKASTGKGLLIDAMTLPGTGRSCPTSAYPYSNEEAVKVKVAIAKACKISVHFDNLEEGTMYGSGPLDSALTSTVIEDRQLGANDMPPLNIRAAWFLSGNNVYPCKDAYRRWLVCNLRTELDKPEERAGLPDLRGLIRRDRGVIVRDALTILRAHTLAGRPDPGWPGFGSFEDWDLVVRGAVWFATGRDCLTTQRQAAAESPERAEKMGLLEGIWELPKARFGQVGMTSDEIVREAEAMPDRCPTLVASLRSRGRAGKLADSRQLGNVLRGMLNTPIGNLKLLKHPILKHKVAAWIVQRCENPEGGSGGPGGSIHDTPEQDSKNDPDMTVFADKGDAYEGPWEVTPSDPQTPPGSKSTVDLFAGFASGLSSTPDSGQPAIF